MEGLPTEGLLLHAQDFDETSGRFLNEVADGEAEYVQPVNAKCATVTTNTVITVTSTIAIANATVTSNGGTAVVTVHATNNEILVSTAGTLWKLVLTLDDVGATVVTFPFCEGLGNRVYGYDAAGASYIGTVATESLTNFWAATQDSYFFGIMNGYSDAENLFPNSHAVGAAVSGDVLPTGWSKNTAAGGLTATVVAVGTGYVDIQVTGTTTAATSFQLWFSGLTDIPASPAEQFVWSMPVEVIAGSLSPSLVQLILLEHSIGSSYLGLTRYDGYSGEEVVSQTFTVSNASTAFVRPQFQVYVGSSGVAIDYTLRISEIQIVSGASSKPYVATTGSPAFGVIPGLPSAGTDILGFPLTHQPGYNNSAEYQVVGEDIAIALGGGSGSGLYYEQLIVSTNVASNSYITLSKDGDWWTASRAVTDDGSRSIQLLGTYTRASGDPAKLTFVVDLLKKPDQTNSVSFGFYQSSVFVTDSYEVTSGPGSISVTSGRVTVTDLSESVVTTVKMVRNTILAGTYAYLYFYPCGSSPGTIGMGCLFRFPHVWRGDTDRAYIEPTTVRQYQSEELGKEADADESVFFNADGSSKTLTYQEMMNAGATIL
jgi:hypothetical protein